eukprot:16080041-Heterocapsa_arctica.AAC.1
MAASLAGNAFSGFACGPAFMALFMAMGPGNKSLTQTEGTSADAADAEPDSVGSSYESDESGSD